ncbi:MAG: DNA polymerase [archaeon]|nr:DNA polymerase [archaeon]
MPSSLAPPNTTLVQDRETARRVVEQLMALKEGDTVYACDTECVGLEINTQSPIGNGRVICASVYAGPGHDFGTGERLWIDNLDEAEGVLDEFRPFFEDPKRLKVWHNYSFDRHILGNHGINVVGFGGDTLHMARLWDASRTSIGGAGKYSLESLTQDLLATSKVGMTTRFSVNKTKKNGEPGKLRYLPPLEELQRSPATVRDWIDYSAFDAEGTWLLHRKLAEKLRHMPWSSGLTMLDFYRRYWLPFGELLTDMERSGIYVNVGHLAEMEKRAEKDRATAESAFLGWAAQYSPEAVLMNANSDAQKRQLFFAPYTNPKSGEGQGKEKVFEVENHDGFVEEGKAKAKKKRPITIVGMGLPVEDWTDSGQPATSNEVLRKLAGANVEGGKYGTAFKAFGGEERGAEACKAIDSLVQVTAISQLMDSFIVPLQARTDAQGRVHTSMNINTETGRLSCRAPNLQNQPALEKDRYGIRKAFCAEPGKRLIVADYGQLELRLLAHMTKCRSMIEAFEKGGDFHSRTALGMYPEVARAVAEGSVLLEWNEAQDGAPPKPLLKDAFGTQRKRAKTLNFSIAYGKTAMGLAKDWSTSVEEAQNTLHLWYADRPEVKSWQEATIAEAERTGYTRTLMGRYRRLPHINNKNKGLKNHSARAAINTPLQGGAADIVMAAMLKIHVHPRLVALGWRLILQIHDELILEGPQESSEEALQIVLDVMGNPLSRPLLISLVVDADIGITWAEAK